MHKWWSTCFTFVHVVVSLSLTSQSRYNVNDRQTTRHQGTYLRLSQNYLPRERYSCKLFVIFATHLLQNKTQLKHVTETPRKIDVKLKHRTRSVHTGWSLSHITFIFIPTYYVFFASSQHYIRHQKRYKQFTTTYARHIRSNQHPKGRSFIYTLNESFRSG